MKRSTVKRLSDKAKSADTRKKKQPTRKVEYKQKKSVAEYSRMMKHSSVEADSRKEDAIKWKLSQSKVFHKDYDPTFDCTGNRFLIRRVLNIKVPLHGDPNFFDKRYMVAPPKDISDADAQKRLDKQ